MSSNRNATENLVSIFLRPFPSPSYFSIGKRSFALRCHVHVSLALGYEQVFLSSRSPSGTVPSVYDTGFDNYGTMEELPLHSPGYCAI